MPMSGTGPATACRRCGWCRGSAHRGRRSGASGCSSRSRYGPTMLTASPARSSTLSGAIGLHAVGAAIRLLDRFETNRLARLCHRANVSSRSLMKSLSWWPSAVVSHRLVRGNSDGILQAKRADGAASAASRRLAPSGRVADAAQTDTRDRRAGSDKDIADYGLTIVPGVLTGDVLKRTREALYCAPVRPRPRPRAEVHPRLRPRRDQPARLERALPRSPVRGPGLP